MYGNCTNGTEKVKLIITNGSKARRVFLTVLKKYIRLLLMKQNNQIFTYSNEKSETLKTMFDFQKQGRSLQEITDHFEENEILTAAGEAWTKIKIHRVLEKVNTTIAFEKLKEDQAKEFTELVRKAEDLNPLHRPILPINFLSSEQASVVDAVLKNGLPPLRDYCLESTRLIPNVKRDPNTVSLLQREVEDQKPVRFKEPTRDQINARDASRTDGLMGMFNAHCARTTPTVDFSQPFPGKEGEDTTRRDKLAYAASLLKVKNGIKTTIQKFCEAAAEAAMVGLKS